VVDIEFADKEEPNQQDDGDKPEWDDLETDMEDGQSKI